MKYKQYLHSNLCGTRITTMKTDDMTSVLDVMDYTDEDAREFRWSRVSFVDDGSADADPDDLLTFNSALPVEVDHESSHVYAERYVDALSGLFPERKLAEIVFCDNLVAFHLIIFDQKSQKRIEDVSIHLVNFPKRTKMVVRMGPMYSEAHDRRGTPDTYFVRNTAEYGEPMRIVIEEYREGALRRTRELGKDEQGEFEIISQES